MNHLSNGKKFSENAASFRERLHAQLAGVREIAAESQEQQKQSAGGDGAFYENIEQDLIAQSDGNIRARQNLTGHHAGDGDDSGDHHAVDRRRERRGHA